MKKESEQERLSQALELGKLATEKQRLGLHKEALDYFVKSADSCIELAKTSVDPKVAQLAKAALPVIFAKVVFRPPTLVGRRV